MAIAPRMNTEPSDLPMVEVPVQEMPDFSGGAEVLPDGQGGSNDTGVDSGGRGWPGRGG